MSKKLWKIDGNHAPEYTDDASRAQAWRDQGYEVTEYARQSASPAPSGAGEMTVEHVTLISNAAFFADERGAYRDAKRLNEAAAFIERVLASSEIVDDIVAKVNVALASRPDSGAAIADTALLDALDATRETNCEDAPPGYPVMSWCEWRVTSEEHEDVRSAIAAMLAASRPASPRSATP